MTEQVFKMAEYQHAYRPLKTKLRGTIRDYINCTDMGPSVSKRKRRRERGRRKAAMPGQMRALLNRKYQNAQKYINDMFTRVLYEDGVDSRGLFG